MLQKGFLSYKNMPNINKKFGLQKPAWKKLNRTSNTKVKVASSLQLDNLTPKHTQNSNCKTFTGHLMSTIMDMIKQIGQSQRICQWWVIPMSTKTNVSCQTLMVMMTLKAGQFQLEQECLNLSLNAFKLHCKKPFLTNQWQCCYDK